MKNVPTPGGPVRTIDVSTLKQEREDGKVPVLVDVRNPDEYAGGRVPDTFHIPLPAIPARYHELDAYRDGPVYLICARGGRSAQAGMFLEGQGFDVVNVMGGTMGWVQAGYEVESD